MGGRHTPIPLQFDAHGLKITSISLSEPSLEVFSGEGPLTFLPADDVEGGAVVEDTRACAAIYWLRGG